MADALRKSGPRSSGKSANAFRTISEVADELGVQQHVLRFWETKFSQIKPMKRGGGRRYYRPEDVELLKLIQYHLHDKGFTIRGVQKLFREQGLKATIAAWQQDISGEAPIAAALSDAAQPVAGANGGADLSTVIAELKALRASLN